MKEINLVLWFWFFLVVAGCIGWGMNLYSFACSDFQEPYKPEIIRGVGIPIPIVGAITGYMTFDGEE